MGHTHKKCSFLVSTWSLILFQKFINILGIHTKHCSFVVLPQVPHIFSRVHARNRCSFIVLPLVLDDLFPFMECLYVGHTHKKQCSFVVLPLDPLFFKELIEELGVVLQFVLLELMTISITRSININGIHTKQCSFVVLPLFPQIFFKDSFNKQVQFYCLAFGPC